MKLFRKFREKRYYKKHQEELDKVFEKGVERIAKLLPIHAVGNPDPYPVKEALEFAETIDFDDCSPIIWDPDGESVFSECSILYDIKIENLDNELYLISVDKHGKAVENSEQWFNLYYRPHKLNFLSRICFRCKDVLYLKDYLKTNIEKEDHNYNNIEEKIYHLIKVWNSKYVQLYCCNCWCHKKIKILQRVFPPRKEKPNNNALFEWIDEE